MKRRRDRPFWLTGGGQICCVCEHAFAVEGGFHCGACDRPICGECVLLDATTGEALCVLCREPDVGAA